MVVATIIVIGLQNTCPDGCSNLLEVVEVGAPKGVIYGTFIVSVMEVIRIVIIMPSDYLQYKYIEPLKQRLFNAGKAQMRAEIVEWMERKEEAEREGIPFDEPMPGAERNGRQPKR